MAVIRGRRCDRVGCGTLVDDAPNLPVGWIAISPKTDKPDDPAMEFCSNYCATYVMLDRYEAESGGRRLVRQPKRKDDQ